MQYDEPEIWSPVSDHPDYLISNRGQVLSMKRGSHILKPYKHKSGYLQVDLDNKTYKIHRLVANNFVYNEKKKPQVHHIDGNKENNWSKNLVWATNAENARGFKKRF